METKTEKSETQQKPKTEQKDNERKKREESIQEKLKEIGQCPMGFDWIKVVGGWQCSAGGHHVSDKELEEHFSH